MRVLVVDDDAAMASAIERALKHANVIADIAATADDALWMVHAAAYDVIVLDVMLPDIEGFEVCRLLRRDGVWTPIIMLTARETIEDRVSGLDAGADDYLTKPFALEELLARLRALARRDTAERPTLLRVDDLTLDPSARQVWRGEVEISLSRREFALLEALMRNPGRVFTHLQLLEAAWEIGYEHRSNVVEVYIRYLREKIDRPFGVETIETVRGVGYRLVRGPHR